MNKKTLQPFYKKLINDFLQIYIHTHNKEQINNTQSLSIFVVHRSSTIVKDTAPDIGERWFPFIKWFRKLEINWTSNLLHQFTEYLPNPDAFSILVQKKHKRIKIATSNHMQKLALKQTFFIAGMGFARNYVVSKKWFWNKQHKK